MAEAFAIGIPPWRIIDMTMRELDACFAGSRILAKRNFKSEISQAWHVGMFSRAKKIPPLRQLLNRIDPPKPMSPAQMRRALVASMKALGATVIRRKKGETEES